MLGRKPRCQEETSPSPRRNRTKHTAAPATDGSGAREAAEWLLLRSPARWTYGAAHLGPTGEEPAAPRTRKQHLHGGTFRCGESLGCRAVSDATFWVSGGVSESCFPPESTQLLAKVSKNNSKGHLAAEKVTCTHLAGLAAGGTRF